MSVRALVLGRLPLRAAVILAVAACLSLVATPFLFFPEITGDVGVLHAGRLRNYSALAAMVVELLAGVAGLFSIARRLAERSMTRTR